MSDDLLTRKGLTDLVKALDDASIGDIRFAHMVCKDQNNCATKASERELWKQLARVFNKLQSDWE